MCENMNGGRDWMGKGVSDLDCVRDDHVRAMIKDE